VDDVSATATLVIDGHALDSERLAEICALNGDDDVAAAVAVGVDVREGQPGGAADRALARFRDERGLLVVDNWVAPQRLPPRG